MARTLSMYTYSLLADISKYGAMLWLRMTQLQFLVVFHISSSINCSYKLILHNSGVLFDVVAIKGFSLLYHNTISDLKCIA